MDLGLSKDFSALEFNDRLAGLGRNTRRHWIADLLDTNRHERLVRHRSVKDFFKPISRPTCGLFVMQKDPTITSHPDELNPHFIFRTEKTRNLGLAS